MKFNLIKYGESPALITSVGEEITYKELASFVDEIKGLLNERELVFLLTSNTVASIAFYLACIESRVVPLLLDENINDDSLEGLMQSYKPNLVMTRLAKSPLKNFETRFSFKNYNVYQAFDGKRDLNDELALLITTSGSTGSPKLVRQSYKNLKSNSLSIIEYLNISSRDRAITSLPMNYVYGLSVVNTHLLSGGSLVLTEDSVFQRSFWNLLESTKVTSFAGVPYTYEMLAKLRIFNRRFSALSLLTQAGGKLPPMLQDKFVKYAKETGKRFIVMYGAAEATARMGYLPFELSDKKIGAMGIAIPGGKFYLIDEAGKEIQKNGVQGELVYEGDNVCMGYALSLEDLNRKDDFCRKLVTGDVAVRDEEGVYTIVGRKKRFLKIYGNRVSLDQVERLLKEKFPENCIACSGKDDLLVVFLDNKDVPDSLLKDFLAEKTNINRSAFKVKYLEKIPVNDSGKIIYSNLVI